MKTNKNQPAISKQFNPKFREKVTTDCYDADETLRDTKKFLTDITGVLLIGVNFRKSPGNINNSTFPWGELNYAIHSAEIENLNLFHRGMALQTRFSPGNSSWQF